MFPVVARDGYDVDRQAAVPAPMSTESTHDVTRLLHAWSEGSPRASEQLLPLI